MWESVNFAAEQFNGRLPETYLEDNRNLSHSVGEIFSNVEPFPGLEHVEEFEKALDLHYRFRNEYVNTCLYPDIAELLDFLKQQHCLNFIISMKPEVPLKRILAVKQWSSKFIKTLSPDSVVGKQCSKAELIALVLEEYSIDKATCVYVGDSWSDISAAQQNGIATIGVTYGDGDTQQLLAQKPQVVADSSRQLRDFFMKEGLM